jgi:hypothetical protein
MKQLSIGVLALKQLNDDLTKEEADWEDEARKHTRIVTVLGVPPVDSPLVAVRAAIVGPA